MKLKSVQINHFKHIVDSTRIDIQDKITCLVGKNESGKTAFLEALRRLKPAQGDAKFAINQHYPAWLEKKHFQEGRDLEQEIPVSAWFDLESDDISAVEDVFGAGIITSNVFRVSRHYNNSYSYDFEVDEVTAVRNMLRTLDLPQNIKDDVTRCRSFQQLVQFLETIKTGEGKDQQSIAACETIETALKALLPNDIAFRDEIWRILYDRVPGFFYYSDYSRLPGRVRIRDLLHKDPQKLDESDHTALSLLRLAATDERHLLNSHYEIRRRELENIANVITHDVLQYWTTNEDLRVVIDISQEVEKGADGKPDVHDEMHVRMYDNRHMLSLPFDRRSSGFQWFFSFLAAFSSYERSAVPLIILLDEPALGLHAKAQKDFLNFIEERVAKTCQVIYTTHSPFMIQPNHLDRVRLVEDKGIEKGAVVTSEAPAADRDTLFPLQGALGYDIIRNLFTAKDNLVVERPSDFIFIDMMSRYLTAVERVGLSERWSIVPLGSADVVPAFVALLDDEMEVTVLVDERKEGHQKLSALARSGFLKSRRIVSAGEVVGKGNAANIEDLFSEDDYINLYNLAFKRKLSAKSLPQDTDSIIHRIERHEGVSSYNYNAPADALLRSKVDLVPGMSSETLENFERLFERLNSTLGE